MNYKTNRHDIYSRVGQHKTKNRKNTDIYLIDCKDILKTFVLLFGIICTDESLTIRRELCTLQINRVSFDFMLTLRTPSMTYNRANCLLCI